MPSTLLLADDSVTIQRVIELTFANEDVRVIAVGDGESAVRHIDADPPDIVLADVDMPKLDGYAVALHIKQSPALRDIPVLLLTGAFAPLDDERARATGCDGVLVKPFEPQQLVERVKALLARRRVPEPWVSESHVDGSTSPELIPSPTLPAPEIVAKTEGKAKGIFEMGFDRLGVALASPARTFGDWDIPRTAGGPPASILRTAELLILPEPPTEPQKAPEPVVAARPVAPVAKTSISVGSAFAALLAAEQAKPAASTSAPSPPVSEAMVEEVVRRVLTRMTEDSVRRLVVDTAERVIRQEIERIKTTPP